MKNIVLHKYLTVNLFILINLICIIDFIIMIFLYFSNPNQFSLISGMTINMGFVAFFIIPISILLIFLEFIIRQCKDVKKSYNRNSKLILHKYFTVNILAFINFINLFNLALFISLNLIGYRWILHFLENVYLLWFVISLIILPISGVSVLTEYFLRKYNIVRKSCNEQFSQQQIKIIYILAIIFFIFYILIITYCLLPPTPAEIEALRYD